MSSDSSLASRYGVFALTDVGGRDHNEDSFLILRISINKIGAVIAVVADGVGGLYAGDVASRMGAVAFSSKLLEKLLAGPALQLDDKQVADALRAAVDYANGIILDNVPRSGTTLVAALVIGDVAYVVNVGDSRAYLITKDEIHQITRDHSQAWEDLQKELVKFFNSGGKPDVRGLAEFKRKFIQNHPKAHVINNVVGFFGKVEPIDVFKITLHKGDVLLLCSDGLSDVLNDHDIHKIVISKGDAAAQKLVEEAKKNATDNITVVLIERNT
ncbi:MAG: protein phosphatase 2C domain-containing protein [Thermoproteus sp.]